VTDDIFVIGLSHHTAPVELREQLSTKLSDVGDELRQLMQHESVQEALLVSTCNRVEIYGFGSVEAMEHGRRYLASRASTAIEPMLYERFGYDAVKQAFRVAASLDSLVVGEPQILGQMKDAFDVSREIGAAGPILGRCFTHAFNVAKRVRSETAIAEGTVSVSSIACELAEKIFDDLRGRRALLVGAGEMGEGAARALHKTGAHLVVLNRSPEKAQALAGSFDGEAHGLEALAAELIRADVVITSAAADGFILDEATMRDVVRARRHRPLFLIDIAVPRNVDPRVGHLDSVFLYDVDDLKSVAQGNVASRRREATAAEAIIEEETMAFLAWKRSLRVKPTIVALRRRFEDVVHDELARTLPRLDKLGPDERAALEKMGAAIVNKLLHAPVRELKGVDSDGNPELVAATVRLFELEASSPPDEPEEGSERAEGGRRFSPFRRLRPAHSHKGDPT
jgi:glutamyl-tRNA reductase